jgi:hypothetical protein
LVRGSINAQEAKCDPVELVRCLERRQMGRVHGDALGPGDLPGQELADYSEVGLVVRADDDERRRPHLAEARPGGRVAPGDRPWRRGRPISREDRLERPALHRGQAFPDVGRHRSRFLAHPVEPGADAQRDGLVDLPGVEEPVLLLVEGIERGRPFPPGQGGSDEEEGPGALGMDEGEVDGDAPAEGVGDEARLGEVQLVEQRAEVVDVGEGPTRKRRLAVAAQVGSDDEVLLGECLDLAVPEPPVADARVQEDDGRALARRVVGDLGPVDPGPAQLGLAC